jgi:uncharacterized linocin/CFP29 family protein
MPLLEAPIDGAQSGDIVDRLIAANMDVNVLRPYVDYDGKTYVSRLTGNRDKDGNPVLSRQLVSNAPTTLPRDTWIDIDRAVMRAAKPRLKAIAAFRGAGLTYNLPNAFGKMVLESPTVGDITAATVSMDPIRESEKDRPEFDYQHTPLPIVHKDFSYTARELAVAKQGGQPLDTLTAEMAGERVAEELERMLLGTGSAYKYGGYYVYGLLNYPNRLTYSLTDPTDVAWTPKVFHTEIMEMKELSKSNYYYGPWALYVGSGWDLYLDGDYNDNYGGVSLRTRVSQIEGVDAPVTLDYLPSLAVVMVQKTTAVARLVMGMEITTVQWETHGGLRKLFKVMGMMVPQMRADANNNTGIVHGSVA